MDGQKIYKWYSHSVIMERNKMNETKEIRFRNLSWPLKAAAIGGAIYAIKLLILVMIGITVAVSELFA
jgi:hypothetical protein